jgi:hypothetical protein
MTRIGSFLFVKGNLSGIQRSMAAIPLWAAPWKQSRKVGLGQISNSNKTEHVQKRSKLMAAKDGGSWQSSETQASRAVWLVALQLRRR